jgi:transposase
MFKSYKYKLLPSIEQCVLLNKHFGSIRFVYNHFLNERKSEYELNKNTLNYYDNAKSLTILKHNDEYKWLNEINSQSLQYSLKSLDGAYQNFFKFKKGFPKFKSKHDKNSFNVPQSVSIVNNKLIIPKFKDGIKLILHREFNGIIKSCTISKTPTNEYFVSILVETIHIKLPKTDKHIGIDLGIKDFVITSEGYKYKNNRYTKTYAKQLKEAQQFDKLIKDTFYLYLNIENKYIKQKNEEYYDFIHKIVDEIFTEMIEIDYIKNDSKKFIPSLIATADGMYLQSMTLENYDIKKNLIDYIDILNECLKI